jgi:hypothetical protein
VAAGAGTVTVANSALRYASLALRENGDGMTVLPFAHCGIQRNKRSELCAIPHWGWKAVIRQSRLNDTNAQVRTFAIRISLGNRPIMADPALITKAIRVEYRGERISCNMT